MLRTITVHGVTQDHQYQADSYIVLHNGLLHIIRYVGKGWWSRKTEAVASFPSGLWKWVEDPNCV